MNNDRLITLAKRRIDLRKFAAEEACEKTLARLRENPDWRVCERNLKLAQVNYVMSDGESKLAAKAEVERYLAQRKKLLKALNASEADLRPQYSCKYCGDTGYVANKPCRCLTQEIHTIIVENSDVGNTSYTFENSRETDKHNLAVYKKAANAVANGQNVLLTGNTGSGKTYLLCACANAAVEQNKSTMFLTAFALNSMFLESHLSNVAEKQAILNRLTSADVLAIDDLGTEPVQRNVTAEYLFFMLNERIQRKKQTFISTNLTLADIRDRYDERIFSRLVDQQITFVAELKGKDKRLEKK